MHIFRKAIITAVSIWAFHGAAFADCKPLQLITSVVLMPSDHKTAEFVPVKVAGISRYMLLDTGGAFTSLTSGFSDELGLERRHGNFEMYNAAGDYTSEFVVSTLELGPLKADRVAFVIAPEVGFNGEKQIGGILAPDILMHYDTEVDFGINKLTLLSQDHCEGKVVYWPAEAVAVVPMRVLYSGHIIIPVTLDGHELYAILDTGASGSTLSIPAAETYYGLKLGSADAPPVGDLLGKTNVKTYSHKFKTLDFQGIAVSNLQVDIIPDMLAGKFENKARTGTRLANKKLDEDKSDMLIGMDVLKYLHIYIAYKEEKIYITPATVPAKTH